MNLKKIEGFLANDTFTGSFIENETFVSILSSINIKQTTLQIHMELNTRENYGNEAMNRTSFKIIRI